MNKLKLSLYILSIGLIVFSCSESTEGNELNNNELVTVISTEVYSITKNVNAAEFEVLIHKGGLLIDVRTPGEVANGAIEGNININFNSPSFKSDIEKLDKNVQVLVYCASGGRSGKTMGMMKDMGFKEVYNLKGGYNGWPNK